MVRENSRRDKVEMERDSVLSAEEIENEKERGDWATFFRYTV